MLSNVMKYIMSAFYKNILKTMQCSNSGLRFGFCNVLGAKQILLIIIQVQVDKRFR